MVRKSLAHRRAQSVHVVMNTTTNELRPGARVFQGPREATVLAVDSDPEAHVWIVHAEDPDEDAFVHRADLNSPCALCERDAGTIDALDDDRPVRVCAGCFEYYAG